MGKILTPTYLYLVKHLRGIIYFSEKIEAEKELDWLRRKFKYRELGVSENLKIEKTWKKLVVLPRKERDPTLDSLFQASSFVCPLVILKQESLKDFERSIIAELRTRKKLNDRELKFNLRLVNYSITDFYLKAIELGKNFNLDERRKLAEKELKRFWRVKKGENGRVLIAYIDPLLIKRKIKNPLHLSIIPSLVLDFR